MNKGKRFFAIVIVALLAIGAVVFFLGIMSDRGRSANISQLTGISVERDIAARPILGVMVENSEAARPQTGLGKAGIVFESVTEGGITRYLALYQEDMPEIVGPVRSLRASFLDWAMGFDASIAHVGGSPQSLETADKRDAKSFNQFDYGEPYFRDDARPSPHNVYTRTSDLRQLQKRLKHKKSKFDKIPRKDDSPSQSPKAPNINIDFSGPNYRVEYRYVQASNSYTRYLAGQPHIDQATQQPITVKNVVVIKMPKGHDVADGAEGSGDAIIFRDGEATEGRWQKPGFSERITIINSEGTEIPLNRGNTWFAVIPADKTVEY